MGCCGAKEQVQGASFVAGRTDDWAVDTIKPTLEQRLAKRAWRAARDWARGGAHNNPPPNTTPLSPGRRGAATARGALGWYRPSVGVPRDVGC